MGFSPLTLSPNLTDRYVGAPSAPTSSAASSLTYRSLSTLAMRSSSSNTTHTTPSSLNSFSAMREHMRSSAALHLPRTMSNSSSPVSTSASLSPLLVANHYMRNRSALLSAFPSARLFSSAPPSTGLSAGVGPAGGGGAGSGGPVKLPVTFKNYPLRYMATFVAIHPTIAWGLMTPMYLLCHYTSLSTLLLAGPQGQVILSTRVPSLVPNGTLYGLTEARARHLATHEGGDPTVEEWMEIALRKFASSSWQVAKRMRNLVSSVKKSASAADGDSSPPGFDLKTLKRVQKLAGDVQTQGLEGLKGKEGEKKSWWQPYVKSKTDEIRIRSIADGVAAYILIKAMLPLRIPLSLWLTPKVVKRFV